MSILKKIAATPPVFRAFELLNVASGEIKAELLISNMCVVNWRNGNVNIPFDKMERLILILASKIKVYEEALMTEVEGISAEVLAEVRLHVEMAKGLLNQQTELLRTLKEEKRTKLKGTKEVSNEQPEKDKS